MAIFMTDDFGRNENVCEELSICICMAINPTQKTLNEN